MAKHLPPETLDLIAERFRTLGEPMRLRLLMALQDGERTVSELVALHHTSQANISKHLAVLTAGGLLRRRKQGLKVYYAIADPSIFNLCESVCGSLKRHHRSQAELLP